MGSFLTVKHSRLNLRAFVDTRGVKKLDLGIKKGYKSTPYLVATYPPGRFSG